MKKAMIFLMCCISLLTSIAFGFYEKTRDDERMNQIEYTEQSTYFYVKEANVTVEEELVILKELSEKYQASFIRSDRLFENSQEVLYRSGIYTSNYFENLNIQLKTGQLPLLKDQFLATYATGDPLQSGTIPDLFQDNLLIFGHLDYFYEQHNTTVIGTYTLDVASEYKEIILQELSNFFGISKDDLLNPVSGVFYGEGTFYLFSLIFIIILFAIFCLMNTFYPISRLKEIGVMKLQGYTYFDIWKQLNQHILILPFVFYLLSIFLQKVIIQDSNYSYFLKLSFIQLIIFFLCFAFSLFMLIMIRKFSISDMLKNFFNFRFSLFFSYLLKFLVFVGLIFTIPQVSTELKNLIQTLNIKKAYEEQQDYMTLANYVYVGNEFEQSLNGNNILRRKLVHLYKELEQTANCQYVNTEGPFSSDILNMIFTDVESEKWANIHFQEDDQFVTMDVNQNYLERLNFSFPFSLAEVFQNEQFTVLVPESLAVKKDKVESFVHWKARSYLYESVEEEPKNIDHIPVRILYYPDHKQMIFSENFNMMTKDNGFIQNPIFFCLSNTFFTERNGFYLDSSAIGNPLRILDTPENQKAIQEAIIHHGLELNKVKFQNILTSGFAQNLLISQTSMIAWGGIIAFAIVVSVLASYYIVLIILISQKKKMFVSRFLGYSLWERYQNEIFYFITIYLFGIAELFVLSWEWLPLLILGVVICIDAFIIYFMVRNYEKKSLYMVLKGEE